MTIKETFSSVLFHRRIESGYTQEQVAHACGINTRTYQALEKGESLPGLRNALSLSIFLDFSLDSLKSEVTDLVLPVPRKKRTALLH